MRLDKFTEKAQEALQEAAELARTLGQQAVEPEHLLLTLIRQAEGVGRTLLERAGVKHDALLRALRSIRGSQRVTDANPESKYQALEKNGRDLTKLAADGKLDPVIGRDEEIRRVIQVLS